MKAQSDHRQLEMELMTLLSPHFEGMTVSVGHRRRWDRPCVTFRWAGFAVLLPEERFHRLVHVIPESFRETRMGGFVWVELAPGETVERFLQLPRSEDVAGRVSEIRTGLQSVNFFERLARGLSPSPRSQCTGDFSLTRDILERNRFSASRINDVKLLFIQHGVYCDCQALSMAERDFAPGADGGR